MKLIGTWIENQTFHSTHSFFLSSMLDTGFEPDIRKLEDLGIPPKEKRCTSMFSATFPVEVQRMAKHFLRDDYIFLVVGVPGGANEDIAQTIEEVPQSNKKERLFQLLEENLSMKISCILSFIIPFRKRTLFDIRRTKTWLWLSRFITLTKEIFKYDNSWWSTSKSARRSCTTIYQRTLSSSCCYVRCCTWFRFSSYWLCR